MTDMNDKLIPIQVNVSICPECHSVLKLDTRNNIFRCVECKRILKIVDLGRNDKTFICTMK